MQSWGGPVAGDDRPTLDAPTKSGVLGLVSGALGFGRADVGAIRSLHDGLGLIVRVDRPGVAGIDFQTIENVPNADGKIRKDPIISRRGYLYDAAFTVLLLERSALSIPLEVIARALRFPRYLPFLGRRGCPPTSPVLILPDVHDGASWEAILDRIAPMRRESSGALEILADADLVELGRGVVERRVRDVTAGTSPRFFDERRVRRVTRDSTEGQPS
jgi:CRISPR system Cascade subunit CasD